MQSYVSKASGGFLAAALLSLSTAGTVRADEVTDWHRHMVGALVKAGVNPIVSSRDGAIFSAAVFDAVNGVERRYTPIHVLAEAPRGASKRAAAVQAAYAVLLARFPAQADDLNAKRAASLAAITDGESKERGIEWGQSVATAIVSWRSTDGISPSPPPFLGGNAPGQWRPTPPANAPGALPQFATMIPWGILSPSQFRPAAPPALDSAQYLADLEEVRQMGSLASPLRSADQTDACGFWASVTATYVWNSAALDFAAAKGLELSDNARLFARLNLAIADALIACWDAKYHYQYWRPITAIQLDATNPDPTWTPLVATPAFPEYTSGHSCLAGAAVAVLIDAFGDQTPFTLSAVTPGWTRSYSSFSSALDEVADARVYSGIHFRTACVVGTSAGANVGSFILANRMQRINGEGE